jgi:MFS family permease
LHAIYLSINHAWRIFGPRHQQDSRLSVIGSLLITYIAVLIAQIFFRADGVSDAITVILAMAGYTGGTANPSGQFTVARIVIGFAICLVLPNTQQIMRDYRPVLDRVLPAGWGSFRWEPSLVSGLVMGTLLVASLLRMSDVSKFLYFQF